MYQVSFKPNDISVVVVGYVYGIQILNKCWPPLFAPYKLGYLSWQKWESCDNFAQQQNP
jgi:hypothetical protein